MVKLPRLALLATLLCAGAFMAGPSDQLELSLVDLNGARHDVGFLPLSTFAPRLSPDGRQVTYDTQDNLAVWVADFPGLKAPRRLTSLAQYPMWSADGQRVIFIGSHNGQQALYWRRVDGTGESELLTDPARAPEHWLNKMQSITFITLHGSDYDIWRYSLADRKATPLVQVPVSSQHSSRVSPDERWLAYVSDETGRFEIYVQPLPQTGARFQITREGGEHPVWSPDGQKLYFNRGDRMFEISVKLDAGAVAATPTPLPIAGFIQGSGRRQFDITADGKQFLLLFPPPRAAFR
jgi:eukaryotic-like serine/threonine-protein kinase